MSFAQLMPAAPQYCLLALSREIRGEIYLAVLLSAYPAPQKFEDAGPPPPSTGYVLRIGKYTYGFTVSNLKYRHASQSLLACNNQMQAEVRNVSARHDKAGSLGLDCGKLDVFTKGGGANDLWLTWTPIPGPVKYICNLEVDVRVHDFDKTGFSHDDRR